MAGTYFDFSNTPITSDTTLKAKWCGCGGPEDGIIASFYQGQGARVTLKSGQVGYLKKAHYQYLDNGVSTDIFLRPDFSGMSIVANPEDYVSVEFGADGTSTLKPYTFNYSYYVNLALVTGTLDYVPRYFLFNGFRTLPELLVKLVVTAPEVSRGFICSRGNAYGQVIFNCPTSAFSDVSTGYDSATGMLNLATPNSLMPTIARGFAIGGTAAGYVLANFPNAANHRKLYKLT